MPSSRPRLRIRQLPSRPPIRQRPTTPQPEPASWIRRALHTFRAWYQRVDWAKHTTVFAALVAAAGLGVTAWGTVKSAEVANDQLAQSRNNQDRTEKAQAQAVTMWLDWNKDQVGTVTVSNRSLAPISVALWGADGLKGWKGYENSPVYSYLGVLPPCTRATFTRSQINQATMPKTVDLWIAGLLYRDSAGVKWQRSSSGHLARTEKSPPFLDLVEAGPFARPAMREAVRAPEEECGTS